MNLDDINQELLHPFLFWREQRTSPAGKHTYIYKGFHNLLSDTYSNDTDVNEIITVMNELRNLFGDETPGFDAVAYSDDKIAWVSRITETQTVRMDVVQNYLVRMHEPEQDYAFTLYMTSLAAASFEAAYRNRIFDPHPRALAA